MAASVATAGEGITYFGKRLFALVLGDLKLPLSDPCRGEATIDAHGYDNTVRLVMSDSSRGGLLSYRREVCVARLQGWAVVGLKSRDGQQIWLSRFLFFNIMPLGSLGSRFYANVKTHLLNLNQP